MPHDKGAFFISPFDNLPDNAQGGFRRAPPHHDSDDPDIIDRMSTPPHPDQCFIAGRRFTVQQTWWVGDDNRLFQAIGRLFSKGRQFAFISDVPYMTQVYPAKPAVMTIKYHAGRCFNLDPVSVKRLSIYPPGRTGDPDLVFCTLNEMKNGFEANETSVGAAPDFIQNGPDYEWVPSVRPGISVENKVPHEVLFALGQTFGTSSLQMTKKCATREFTGSIYVHAFQTASATREHVSKFDVDLGIQWWTIAGSKYDFPILIFLPIESPKRTAVKFHNLVQRWKAEGQNWKISKGY
ncbi:hypothetical protein EDD22DRAFT_853901 [Suillus occidentalis]|nr:hypothetical protein EDD22DRAFT_853901 [Suillus occidentalis]